jgi:hypothetical protein
MCIYILLWHYIGDAESDVLWMLGPNVVLSFICFIDVLAVVY